jgi:protein-arginine kinase activator protein McsA
MNLTTANWKTKTDVIVCRICKEPKAETNFPFRIKAQNKRHTICKPCRLVHRAITRLSNEEYKTYLEAQNYCCAICGINATEERHGLYVDHSYTTHKVRGLLCHKCNSGIAFFKDNTDHLAMAIEYLVKHDGITS